MNVHWEHKKKRSTGMSNAQIDDYYQFGASNGALGGKLIGAGGGGFLMFYTEDKTRLRHAMRAAGLREVRFRFDFEGTKDRDAVLMGAMLPAAILAGGLATRLRPLTETIPKALIEIAGEPFIAHQLRLLRDRGIERVVLCVGFLGKMIRDYVGDGSTSVCAWITHSTARFVLEPAALSVMRFHFWAKLFSSSTEILISPATIALFRTSSWRRTSGG